MNKLIFPFLLIAILVIFGVVMSPKPQESCKHPSTTRCFVVVERKIPSEALPIMRSTLETEVRQRCTTCGKFVESGLNNR